MLSRNNHELACPALQSGNDSQRMPCVPCCNWHVNIRGQTCILHYLTQMLGKGRQKDIDLLNIAVPRGFSTHTGSTREQHTWTASRGSSQKVSSTSTKRCMSFSCACVQQHNAECWGPGTYQMACSDLYLPGYDLSCGNGTAHAAK